MSGSESHRIRLLLIHALALNCIYSFIYLLLSFPLCLLLKEVLRYRVTQISVFGIGNRSLALPGNHLSIKNLGVRLDRDTSISLTPLTNVAIALSPSTLLQ